MDVSELRLPLETLHAEPHSVRALASVVRSTVATLRIARCVHLYSPCTCQTVLTDPNGLVVPWLSVHRLAMDACLGVAPSRELVPTGGPKVDFPVEISLLSIIFPELEILRIEVASEVSRRSRVTALHY